MADNYTFNAPHNPKVVGSCPSGPTCCEKRLPVREAFRFFSCSPMNRGMREVSADSFVVFFGVAVCKNQFCRSERFDHSDIRLFVRQRDAERAGSHLIGGALSLRSGAVDLGRYGAAEFIK